MTSMLETGGRVIPPIDLPTRLAIARNYAGMTQTDLARAIGASRATVVNYETSGGKPGGKGGAGQKPRRGTVMAWALATGVNLHWLITGEEPSPDGDGPSFDLVRPKGFEPLTFCRGVWAA